MSTNFVNYVVLRYMRDSTKGVSVPVGILFWQDGTENFNFRIPIDNEKVPGAGADFALLLPVFTSNLKSILRTKRAPFAPTSEPLSTEWWGHLKRVFHNRFQIDVPRRIEVQNIGTDMELQYDAIVQPSRPEEREDARIDSIVNEVLGPWAAHFEGHSTVSGFEGREVRVLKRATTTRGTVVLDAVNLAAKEAERNLEAMLLRGHELSQYAGDERVIVLLGYLASPEGLNGEAKLVSFGERLIGRPLLNLNQRLNVSEIVKEALQTSN